MQVFLSESGSGTIFLTYLQLLYRDVILFITTLQGNYRIFTLQRVPETNLVKGTRGEVKLLISRKRCSTQFYRLLEYQVNDGQKFAIS